MTPEIKICPEPDDASLRAVQKTVRPDNPREEANTKTSFALNRRIVIRQPGGLEVLELIEEPSPSLREEQVRIRVLASGVAFGDVLLHKGARSDHRSYPVTPGYDFVGVVEEIGPKVVGLKIGDRVGGLTLVGGYTQYLCIDAEETILIPKDVKSEEAVSIILNYSTAYELLKRAGVLRSGASIFIYGAAGGMGTAFLQLSKLYGIKIIGSASMSKHHILQEAGAIAIDPKREDLVSNVLQHFPEGVDAVFDPIGGDNLSTSYRLLNKRGRLIVFGTASAISPSSSLNMTLLKTALRLFLLKIRLNRKCVELFSIAKIKIKKPNQFRKTVAHLLDLLAQGKISPQISSILPLQQAMIAHQMLESRSVTGKIVLVP